MKWRSRSYFPLYRLHQKVHVGKPTTCERREGGEADDYEEDRKQVKRRKKRFIAFSFPSFLRSVSFKKKH